VENCDGVGVSCPADTFAASTVCRASVGICDVAESCTGTSGTCPADTFAGTGTLCRSSGGVCDLAESCTGAAVTCPADAFKSQGVACTDDSQVCTTDVCDGFGVCSHNPNSLACSDGLFCTGADTCSGGICSVHAGDPCLTETSCNEATDVCDPCAHLTLPATQACVVGRDCTVSVGLATNGLSVGEISSALLADPATTCTGCTVAAAAANGSCSVNSDCTMSVVDVTPPPTAFSDGEVARVTVNCSQEGSGSLCIGDTVLATPASDPLPVCSEAQCASYECADCEPGDCNTTPGVDAGDPIAVVHCVVGDANPLFDCTCGADCNCQNGTDVADAICSVRRLIGAFTPDTCAGAASPSVQEVAAFVVVRELAATEDSDRSVVRLRGEEAGEVAGLHVTLESGDAGRVRLSRRLARRGFGIQQVQTDGHAGVVVTPPSRFPIESIGNGAVLRIRHHGGHVRVGSTEYGSTEGLSLHGRG